MTELERLQAALERQYAARPVASLFGALFIGGSDYQCFDEWEAGLKALRNKLVDLCEGRVESICNHPTGAIIQHPKTRQYRCDLCGKDLRK